MIQTVEALGDSAGQVQLLGEDHVGRRRRSDAAKKQRPSGYNQPRCYLLSHRREGGIRHADSRLEPRRCQSVSRLPSDVVNCHPQYPQ
jgi:hypothetical protein